MDLGWRNSEEYLGEGENLPDKDTKYWKIGKILLPYILKGRYGLNFSYFSEG